MNKKKDEILIVEKKEEFNYFVIESIRKSHKSIDFFVQLQNIDHLSLRNYYLVLS